MYGHCLVIHVKMNLNFVIIDSFSSSSWEVPFEAELPVSNGGGNQYLTSLLTGVVSST